jgi:hypothetical protein
MYHKALDHVMKVIAKHNLTKEFFNAENKTLDDFEELLKEDIKEFQESE